MDVYGGKKGGSMADGVMMKEGAEILRDVFTKRRDRFTTGRVMLKPEEVTELEALVGSSHDT